MAYDIPQELEYEEKIIFNLTWKQLAYATIFLPPALLILLKLPYSIEIRIILASIPITLGIAFMFFNFASFIQNTIRWFQFRNTKFMSKKMKEYVGIQKIEKDVLFLKNGLKLGFLCATPLNFLIKEKTEQESITKSFQRFLNSIDFGIQILITNENIELEEYFDDLEKHTTSKQIFEQYKKHLNETVNNKGVVNRKFYIIIPEKSSIELDIQLDICQSMLESVSIETNRVSEKAIIHLLKKFFNQDIEKEKKELLISEEITSQNYLEYLVSPISIKNLPNHFIMNNTLQRVIAVHGYPRSVESGFLDRIITLDGDFDISIHINPFPIEETMILLNRELQKQRADLYALQMNSIVNPSLELKLEDTMGILGNIQKGKEKLFGVSLYINCRAESIEKLNSLTKRIEAELHGLLMIPQLPLFQMARAVKSVSPLSQDELLIQRKLTTQPLSAFFPFTSKFLEVDNKGVWFGLNKHSSPIIKDIFSLSNPNGLVLGTSGGGKSFFTKLFILRHLMSGTRVLIVDPQGEYTDLVHKFKGQLVKISRNSPTIINPLDLMGHEYAEKRLALMDLMNIMLGGLSDIQKAVIDRALTETYARKGITQNPATWKKTPPLLSDLLYELEIAKKIATITQKPTYQSLCDRLSMYVDGVFGFFNTHTKIDLKNQLVCFHLGDMPRQVIPVAMFLVLDYLYLRMKKDLERKLLILEEGWFLLSKAEQDSYVFEIVKTCRKFNLGILFLTQEVADLVRSPAGNALLANSSYTLLLKQKPAVIDAVVDAFHLSSTERNYLLSAHPGEGILLLENDHSELTIVASEEEHKLITTNPDEKLQIQNEKQGNTIMKQDNLHEKQIKNPIEEQDFYPREKLNEEQVEFLLHRGFVLCQHVPLGGGRQLPYVLKPRSNETSSHFFIVKEIERYILQFTKSVKLYVAEKPDIVFTALGEEYAIEVETGIAYDTKRSVIKQKVKSLKKEFGHRWFFVVTDSDYAYKYAKFGPTFTRKSVPKLIRAIFKKEDIRA